jgi:hypothetical protein
VEVGEAFGGLPDDLKGPGVVVVHGAKQKNYLVAVLTQRADKPIQSVIDILQGRVGPHAGTVEEIARDDGEMRALLPRLPNDVVHAPERVLAAEVVTVSGGARQIAQVDVAGMQNSNHLRPSFLA